MDTPGAAAAVEATGDAEVFTSRARVEGEAELAAAGEAELAAGEAELAAGEATLAAGDALPEAEEAGPEVVEGAAVGAGWFWTEQAVIRTAVVAVLATTMASDRKKLRTGSSMAPKTARGSRPLVHDPGRDPRLRQVKREIRLRLVPSRNAPHPWRSCSARLERNGICRALRG
jgi:hypothetical protein